MLHLSSRRESLKTESSGRKRGQMNKWFYQLCLRNWQPRFSGRQEACTVGSLYTCAHLSSTPLFFIPLQFITNCIFKSLYKNSPVITAFHWKSVGCLLTSMLLYLFGTICPLPCGTKLSANKWQPKSVFNSLG